LEQINAIGRNIIDYLPNPQVKTATDAINFTGTDSLFDRADEYTYKLEHSVTERFRLTGSFMYYKSREPGGNPLGIVAGSTTSNTPYLLYRHVDATALNAIFTANPPLWSLCVMDSTGSRILPRASAPRPVLTKRPWDFPPAF
jgi:hypothetical protein